MAALKRAGGGRRWSLQLLEDWPELDEERERDLEERDREVWLLLRLLISLALDWRRCSRVGVEDVDRKRCGEGEIGPRLLFPAADVGFRRMGLRLRERETLARLLFNFSFRSDASSLAVLLAGAGAFLAGGSFRADDDEFRLDLFRFLRSVSDV